MAKRARVEGSGASTELSETLSIMANEGGPAKVEFNVMTRVSSGAVSKLSATSVTTAPVAKYVSIPCETAERKPSMEALAPGNEDAVANAKSKESTRRQRRVASRFNQLCCRSDSTIAGHNG